MPPGLKVSCKTRSKIMQAATSSGTFSIGRRPKRQDRIRGDCDICLSENRELLACHHSECKGSDGQPNRACISCHQRFIENNAAQVPMCMWNQHAFGRVFVHSHFPQSWIKGPLAQKRSEQLAEDQAAILPALQDKAVEFKHFHRITMKESVRPFPEIYQDLKRELRIKRKLIAQVLATKTKMRKLQEEFDAACAIGQKTPSATEIYAKVERVLRERVSADRADRVCINASAQILNRIKRRIMMDDNEQMIASAVAGEPTGDFAGPTIVEADEPAVDEQQQARPGEWLHRRPRAQQRAQIGRAHV